MPRSRGVEAPITHPILQTYLITSQTRLLADGARGPVHLKHPLARLDRALHGARTSHGFAILEEQLGGSQRVGVQRGQGASLVRGARLHCSNSSVAEANYFEKG
jgi:hypothetical protein